MNKYLTQEQIKYLRQVTVNIPFGRCGYLDFGYIFQKDIPMEEIEIILNERTPSGVLKTEAWGKRRFNEYFAERDKIFQECRSVIFYDEHCHRRFTDPDELVEFWSGTSKTKAEAFLATGNGFTGLEKPCYLEHSGQYEETGIQVMLENWRWREYAERKAWYTEDTPACIHGWIPARYLYSANNENEYSIPCTFYNKIERGEVLL